MAANGDELLDPAQVHKGFTLGLVHTTNAIILVNDIHVLVAVLITLVAILLTLIAVIVALVLLVSVFWLEIDTEEFSSNAADVATTCIGFKRADPDNISNGHVHDSRLSAVIHVERVDPAQVHEGASVTLQHHLMFTVCSRARASPRICTKSENDIVALRYIDRTRGWKSRVLHSEIVLDLRHRIHPREIHDSLAKSRTDTS